MRGIIATDPYDNTKSVFLKGDALLLDKYFVYDIMLVNGKALASVSSAIVMTRRMDMTNLLKLSAIAILSLTATAAQAGDCVEVGSAGTAEACVKQLTPTREYTVGPKEAPTLVYKDCEPRGEGEYECWAAGIRTGRLFVHRKNGRLFASLQPKG